MDSTIRISSALNSIAKIITPSSECVILDTETTGLGYNAEIIEISIISLKGEVLLDTLVKPSQKIPLAISEINNITDEMVQHAPGWSEVLPVVLNILDGKKYIAWNSDFDARLLMQTTLINSYCSCLLIDYYETFKASQIDGQELYSQWVGEPNKGHTAYRRQRLVNAATQQNVTPRGTPHRALADCFMVLDVLNSVAGGNSNV